MSGDDRTTATSSPAGAGSMSPDYITGPRFHPAFRSPSSAAIFQSGSDSGDQTPTRSHFSLGILREISTFFWDLSSLPSGNCLDTPVPIELPVATAEGLALVLHLVRDALDLDPEPFSDDAPPGPSSQGWPAPAVLDNVVSLSHAYDLQWAARRLCRRVPVSSPAQAFQRFALAAATGQDVGAAAGATVLFDLHSIDEWAQAYLARDAEAHIALFAAHLGWSRVSHAFESSFLEALPNVVGQCRWPQCFAEFRRVFSAIEREWRRDGDADAHTMYRKGRTVIAAGSANPSNCAWCRPNYDWNYMHSFDTVIRPFFNGTDTRV